MICSSLLRTILSIWVTLRLRRRDRQPTHSRLFRDGSGRVMPDAECPAIDRLRARARSAKALKLSPPRLRNFTTSTPSAPSSSTAARAHACSCSTVSPERGADQRSSPPRRASPLDSDNAQLADRRSSGGRTYNRDPDTSAVLVPRRACEHRRIVSPRLAFDRGFHRLCSDHAACPGGPSHPGRRSGNRGRRA
jgi:hypothetical protein